MIGWYVWRMHNAEASLRLSGTSPLRKYALPTWVRHVPFALRVLAIALLCIALARPQLTNRWQSESTEGIDIMMALDISGTMLAEDLKPNRLEAAKNVGSDFILARTCGVCRREFHAMSAHRGSHRISEPLPSRGVRHD